jgi:hypothetical protein
MFNLIKIIIMKKMQKAKCTAIKGKGGQRTFPPKSLGKASMMSIRGGDGGGKKYPC